MLARRMIVSSANLEDAAQVAELEAWIGARSDSTPFHRPAWISAVARGTGQQAMMLVCRHGGGDVAGVLPLNLIHSPLFGRALVSSGFAVDGGILADDAAVAEALSTECWRLAEAMSCPTAELRGGALPREGWALKTGAYLNFAKPLEADDEAQLLAIPRKHRAEVRKGLDNSLDIEFGRSQRLLDTHYRLYAENVHRLGTPVFPKAMFAEVLAAFGDNADIVLVSKDGAPLAARRMRSNEAGYFHLMSHARQRGCTHFDFGRSKVGTGPAAWKKTWGWEGEPLTYATRAAPGREARDINPLSPQYSRKVELWKKLPLPLASFIGPYISRGLG